LLRLNGTGRYTALHGYEWTSMPGGEYLHRVVIYRDGGDYARVLEIPTPRWTAYEANRFDIKMEDGTPMITVERAYTSPIWYTPDQQRNFTI